MTFLAMTAQPSISDTFERVAVISDVHGNAVALAAVLHDVQRISPDLIVCGGDLTWGPQPQETLQLARAVGVPVRYVRGNAERALLEPSDKPTPRERWLLERHSAEDIAFIRTFEENVVIDLAALGRVRFCHGSPRSDEECITPATPDRRIRELMAGVAEQILVSAHTHIQFDRAVAGIRSINAGSVGMPYEGRDGAFWAVLGTDVELQCTGYPLADAVAAYRASGDPLTDAMIEILESSPTRDEVIEHAESHVFAG